MIIKNSSLKLPLKNFQKRLAILFTFLLALTPVFFPQFNPANAAHTQVSVNFGNLVVVNPNTTSEITVNLTVNGVDAQAGLGAFDFNVVYDNRYLHIPITNLNGIPPAGTVNLGPFLASTARQTECDAPAVRYIPDSVTFYNISMLCTTLGQTPQGPQGSGVLASFKFQPDLTYGQETTLSIADSVLADASIDAAEIVHTKVNGTIRAVKCANLDGQPAVSIGDILMIVNLFGTNPQSPNWNPNADLDYNNGISIADILIAVTEFGQTCPTT